MKKIFLLVVSLFCLAACQKEEPKPEPEKFTFVLTGKTYAGISHSGEWGVYGLRDVKQGFKFLSATRVQRQLFDENNNVIKTKDTTYTLTTFDTGFTMFAFLPKLNVDASDAWPSKFFDGYFTNENTLMIMGTTMTKQ